MSALIFPGHFPLLPPLLLPYILAATMKMDTFACLESWADELLSHSQRVRTLISDAHWLSDNLHKEALGRKFLSRYR
jgi:hypothetical protein